MLGVGIGLLASLLAAGFEPETLAQAAAVATLGSGVGAVIGRRITAVELPQMVAALHSVVGLAAVFTSMASIFAHPEDTSSLHMVTAYLGVLIGNYGAQPKSRLPLADPLHSRGGYFHWFRRCILEASGKDVVEAAATSWSSCD